MCRANLESGDIKAQMEVQHTEQKVIDDDGGPPKEVMPDF